MRNPFRKKLEPWEIAEEENYPFKRGRMMVKVVAVGSVAFTVFSAMLNRFDFVDIIAIIIGVLLAYGFYYGYTVIKYLFVISAFITVLISGVMLIQSNANDVNVFIGVNIGIQLLFNIFTLYVVFIDKNAKGFLEAQKSKR
jgi:hypothetical protein